MEYRYKRGQIFKKKLNVPNSILNRVYECRLSLEEYINYELYDKIPTSCILEVDRKILERFGLEKCKNLDWETINTREYYFDENIRDLLMTIDPKKQDINKELYELLKDIIYPEDYPPKMKELYSNRIAEINDNDDNISYNINHLKGLFNRGKLDLLSIVLDWEIFKSKDLSLCLLNDESNTTNITDEQLKTFMNTYGGLIRLICSKTFNDKGVYSFISEFNKLQTENEKKEYIKTFTDYVIYATSVTYFSATTPYNYEYKEIFKYSSIEDSILKNNSYYGKYLIEELKTLPDDYIFNLPFPINLLFEYNVSYFLSKYGLKNVVDFNNECGNFFTKNNCEMLRSMNDLFLHYPPENFDTRKGEYQIDKNGNKVLIKKPYTKDEFYEAIKNMLVHGPTQSKYDPIMNMYIDPPSYENMTGEFRTRFPELFIDEKAPKQLKKLFYSKKISPKIISNHPEYVPFLKGKNVSSCFENRSIQVTHTKQINGERVKEINYYNFYEYFSQILKFEEFIRFISDYSEILDIIYNRSYQNVISEEFEINQSDNIETIKKKIAHYLRMILIKTNIPYPKKIPNEIINNNRNMFLPNDAPQELKELFYNRQINTEFILSNPQYMDYFKKIDIELLYKYMPINYDSYHIILRKFNSEDFISLLISELGRKETFNFMLSYGKYIEKLYKKTTISFYDFYNYEQLTDIVEKNLYDTFMAGYDIEFDEDIPDHFKIKYPKFFLEASLPTEIKNKFYNRELIVEDFEKNDLIKQFGKTNIACGFDLTCAWIIPLFEINYETDFELANTLRLRTIKSYKKINSPRLKNKFISYIKKNEYKINLEMIDQISEVITRIEYSNSIEISSFKDELGNLILETKNPLDSLNKIEKVFLKNNLPLCGKMFLCFQILYPNLSLVRKFSFSTNSRVATRLKDNNVPNVSLNSSKDENRLAIIFNDLLRISYRSNERSLIEYLNNIETGSAIFSRLQNTKGDLNALTKEEKKSLEIFIDYLEVLYQNTKKGKQENINIEKLPLFEKLMILSKEFKESDRYDLKNRIVRSFCFTAGIKSFDDFKKLISDSREEQRARIEKVTHEIEINNEFKIKKGDFIRCIGCLDAFSSSIGTGNFCKEHLGVFRGTSDTDTTPLDVDLSQISDDSNIYNAVKNSPTGFGFGNIFIVIKKENPNIIVTRDEHGYELNTTYNPKRAEVFGTHIEGGGGYETHWGARTGVSFADIDCIIYKDINRIIDDTNPYDENGNVNYVTTKDKFGNTIQENADLNAIKFEIVKNGYYIPVVDFSGKLIFTKEEFYKIQNKMHGLSYYNHNKYELSDSLITPEVEEISNTLTDDSYNDIANKREKINNIITKSLQDMNLKLKTKMDNDLTPGSIEFIDTGSTGRKTNIPYDGDFDFFMRLDADIIRNDTEFNNFKEKIISEFKKYKMENFATTDKGDLRFKKVQLDDNTIVDIDISFGIKTNKIVYSSDECLKDRLNTIKKIYPDKYKYVVSNIILAKKLLKDPSINAYKPRRSDKEQGGIGGIGVENWILQNGGSLIQACKEFLQFALDKNGKLIPFNEFKKLYRIWDFGENHFSARDNKYLHDNFIFDNMNEVGYEKMAKGIIEYLKKVNIKQEQPEDDEDFSFN